MLCVFCVENERETEREREREGGREGGGGREGKGGGDVGESFGRKRDRHKQWKRDTKWRELLEEMRTLSVFLHIVVLYTAVSVSNYSLYIISVVFFQCIRHIHVASDHAREGRGWGVQLQSSSLLILIYIIIRSCDKTFEPWDEKQLEDFITGMK